MVDDSVRESVIEKYLVTRLRYIGMHYPYYKCVVKKIGGPGWRGWPDRMILFEAEGSEWNGYAHWLELKRPKGGRFEPLQLRMHKKLRAMRFVVRVVNTRALVDQYITEVCENGPHRIVP